MQYSFNDRRNKAPLRQWCSLFMKCTWSLHYVRFSWKDVILPFWHKNCRSRKIFLLDGNKRVIGRSRSRSHRRFQVPVFLQIFPFSPRCLITIRRLSSSASSTPSSTSNASLILESSKTVWVPFHGIIAANASCRGSEGVTVVASSGGTGVASFFRPGLHFFTASALHFSDV
ncbi:hypothetical protein ABFS83_01G099700 [Erythranthe nasuta]